MDGLEKKTLKVSRGFTYTYYTSRASTIDPSKPTLLLTHGFPDEALLWGPIASRLTPHGYRLIIPDMLGYAGTSKPLEKEHYRYKLMTTDLTEILDAESVPTVISVGHDWGSDIAQRLCLWHPSRVSALVMLNLAYLPAGPDPVDLASMNKMAELIFGYPSLEYQLFLTAPEAPAILDANLDRVFTALHGQGADWMQRIFCQPGAIRKWLLNPDGDWEHPVRPYATPELRAHFVQRFAEHGFAAPVNYYHSVAADQNRHDEWTELSEEQRAIGIPCLFVGCTQDAVCRPELAGQAVGKGLMPDLESMLLDCGHWSPLEKPEEIAEGIVGFLEKNKDKIEGEKV